MLAKRKNAVRKRSLVATGVWVVAGVGCGGIEYGVAGRAGSGRRTG
jgi:hypothetical protein